MKRKFENYRQTPGDLPEYKGPEPRVFCDHCAYTSPGRLFCEPPIPPEQGREPPTYHGAATLATHHWRRSEANPDGKCKAFKPSALTRALRIVGRRKPVER